MLKIENTDIYGFEAAIRGMRNPMNSWAKSDSFYTDNHQSYIIGPNDLKLMQNLCAAGSDHGKFMRMINVTMDITAPLYWWKEFDTYKVGTVANSCSTMHKIAAKKFERRDFSYEHLFDFMVGDVEYLPIEILDATIVCLNTCRDLFLNETDIKQKKDYWWQMIQLLPSSYNQKRTVHLNYQVLLSIYKARCNHKLDEWHILCDWILALPYFKEITGITKETE